MESEYIVMEEASDTQLGEVWDDMDISKKFRVVEDLVAVEKRLMSLSFTL